MRGYLNKRVTEKIFIENKLSSFSFHKSSKGPFQNLLGAMSSFLMESSLAVLTSERTSKSISSDWFSACNFRLAEEAWTNACPHSGGIKRKLWRHAQQEIVLKLPARLRQVPKVSAKVVGAWSPAPSRGRQPQIGAHPPPRREALSLFYSGWRRGLCPPDREGANRAHLAPVFRRKTERTPPPPDVRMLGPSRRSPVPVFNHVCFELKGIMLWRNGGCSDSCSPEFQPREPGGTGNQQVETFPCSQAPLHQDPPARADKQ